MTYRAEIAGRMIPDSWTASASSHAEAAHAVMHLADEGVPITVTCETPEPSRKHFVKTDGGLAEVESPQAVARLARARRIRLSRRLLERRND